MSLSANNDGDALSLFRSYASVAGVDVSDLSEVGGLQLMVASMISDAPPGSVAAGDIASGTFGANIPDTGTYTFPGALNVSGVTTITTTTANQLAVRYDASNHFTASVSSAGAVTLNATGASAGFSFSDLVTAAAGLTVSSGQTLTISGATVTGLTAASVGAGTFPGGAYAFTGATTLTGGAGNMTVVAGTGNSRTLILQATSSGGTATTNVTLSDTTAVWNAIAHSGISTLDTTGAIVAGGDVTANGGDVLVTSAAGVPRVLLTATTGTNASHFQAITTGGTYYFGSENSAGGVFGATAYAQVVFAPAGRNIEFFPGAAKKVTFADGGAVVFAGALSGITTLAGTDAISGFTSITLTGLVQTTLTTQQLSLRYDASNHLAVTVASDGATTFNATGTGAAFVFSDAVTVSASITMSAGNLLIGGSVGATAAKTIALSNSATAPTTTADLTHLYSADISAGNASLAIFQEQAPNAAVGVASTHRLPITINGTQYAVLLTTVLS